MSEDLLDKPIKQEDQSQMSLESTMNGERTRLKDLWEKDQLFFSVFIQIFVMSFEI